MTLRTLARSNLSAVNRQYQTMRNPNHMKNPDRIHIRPRIFETMNEKNNANMKRIPAPHPMLSVSSSAFVVMKSNAATIGAMNASAMRPQKPRSSSAHTTRLYHESNGKLYDIAPG